MAGVQARKNKEGKITSYQITVCVGYDEQKKKIVEKKTYHPKAKTPAKALKEAKEFAVLWEKKVKEGTAFTEAEKTSFSQLVKQWDELSLSPRVRSGSLSAGVRESYLSTLECHVVKKIGRMKLDKIKAIHIDSIMADLAKAGRKPATIRNIFGCIRACFNFAVRKGIVRENPCMRCEPLPEIGNNAVQNIYNVDQIDRLLNDALVREYEYEIKREGKRAYSKTERFSVSAQFRALFTLSFFSGFRRGELIGLNWEDIDFEEKTVKIERSVALSKNEENHVQYIKDPKTESGFRTLALPTICFDLLKEWKREQREICLKLGTAWEGYTGRDYDKNPVFIQTGSGKRMNLQTPTAKFRKILEAYNQAVAKEGHEELILPIVRLHDLRHTVASHMYNNGIDIHTISRRLGHSKVSFTMDRYGHALDDNDKKASDKLEEVFAMRMA